MTTLPAIPRGDGTSALPGDSFRRMAPVPLDLTEIPIVLPAKAQGERDASGAFLEERFYCIEECYTSPNGTRRHYEVKGDPEMGLPYGKDLQHLLATLRLVDRDGDEDGRLERPYIRDFAEITGKVEEGEAPGGSYARSLHSFLRRAASVRITTTVETEETQQIAMQLRRGAPEVFPRLPDGPVGGTRREQALYLLQYEISRVGRSDGTTEHRIDWIQVNPVFIHQSIIGKLALIDLKALASLNAPTAQLLYLKLAGPVARTRRLDSGSRIALGLPDLWRFCRLTPDQAPSRAKNTLVRASEQLVDIGVLDQPPHVTSPRYGEWAFHFHPGPLLLKTYYGRGCGQLDLPWVREALARLAQFGIFGETARELVHRHTGRLREVLPWMEWLREHRSGVVKKSWSGFLIFHVRDEKSLERHELYQEYLDRKTGSEGRNDVGSQEMTASSGEPPSPSEEHAPPPRPARRPDIDPQDEAAVRIWRALLEDDALRAELPARARTVLEHAAPHRIEEETLVCIVDNQLCMRWQEEVRPLLEEPVCALGEGRVSNWRLELASSLNDRD